MAFNVASMMLVVPAASCELITVIEEPRSRDTRLSQPGGASMLVGISLRKLFSNEVVSENRITRLEN
jgi:hypothetical protein